jgi:hypothetical protein
MRAAARFVLVAGGWALSSCAPSGFADPALVQSVRILASSADTPYAQPGAQVNLHVLAIDGRTTQTEPMTLSWLPFVCENPPDDAYYACFQGLAGGDGGAPGPAAGDGGGGVASVLQPGVNLTPLLPSGASYGFQMPTDAVSAHPPVKGATPYGLAILFNVACAGHLELLPFDPGNNNPQQVPLGCFDTDENQLGPDDWVLGFTRVYSYAPDAGPDGGSITNANPIVSSIDVNGGTLNVTADPSAPQIYTTLAFTSSRCTASTRDNCPHVPIGPSVPNDSWELNPLQTDVNGNASHEEIWAEFFTSFGSFTDDARLLYDATSGSVGDPSATNNQWLPPNDAGDGFIWIVVHDNRGGASWVTIPVHVQ